MQVERVDFEQVTAGLSTKSDKMRALARRGVKTADIARYLGVRYQHARNVLAAAGLHQTETEQGPALPPRDRKSTWLTVGIDGCLHLPADLMGKRGLASGDRVYLGQTEDGLELLSQRAALARAQAIARKYIPADSPSLVDELIAERRREAELENE